MLEKSCRFEGPVTARDSDVPRWTLLLAFGSRKTGPWLPSASESTGQLGPIWGGTKLRCQGHRSFVTFRCLITALAKTATRPVKSIALRPKTYPSLITPAKASTDHSRAPNRPHQRGQPGARAASSRRPSAARLNAPYPPGEHNLDLESEQLELTRQHRGEPSLAPRKDS